MRVLLVTPRDSAAHTGNRCSAVAWARMLEGLGHSVRVAEGLDGGPADLLVAVHAAKSAAAVRAFRGPVVVVLSGTDFYPEPQPETLGSLDRADRIVVLQPRARDRLPQRLSAKTRVIVQSAEPPAPAPPRNGFDVAVVAHLRAIKDPLRAAAAARLLPAASRVRVLHAGAILESGYTDRVAQEQAENPRYRWLGEIAPDEARRLLASCRLSVVASFHEGGGRVIGESLVAGTPVLAARNDASESLLGADYPGLFDPGDTAALAGLLRRAENGTDWLPTKPLAGLFHPDRERDAWRALLEELRA